MKTQKCDVMEVLFHLLIKLNAAGDLLCCFSDIALHEVGFLQPGKSGLKCLSSSAFMIAFALSLSLTYFPGEERAFAVDWLAVRNSCWFCQSTLRNGVSPQ